MSWVPGRRTRSWSAWIGLIFIGMSHEVACGQVLRLAGRFPPLPGGVLAPVAAAADPIVYSLSGKLGEPIGPDLVVLGDVNGDGIKDFVMNARQGADPNAWGELNLHSGKDGKVLRSWNEPESTYVLGSGGLGLLPDLDADGLPEIGAVSYLVALLVLSPVTGKEWYRVPMLGGQDGGSNVVLLSLPDIDGDGIGEFAMTAAGADKPASEGGEGRVTLHSGTTGSVLWTQWGSAARAGLGFAAIRSGDHDGDQAVDILCGEGKALLESPDLQNAERDTELVVLSSRTGNRLRVYSAPGPNLFRFGERMVSLGDWDGNGFPEVAISAPAYHAHLRPNGSGRQLGWAGVLKLPELQILHNWIGRDPRPDFGHGEEFGATLACAGDADGDGTPDVLVGSRDLDSVAFDQGRFYLYSGADGRLLTGYEGYQAAYSLVHSLHGLDDLDGDGRDEFMVLVHENNPSDLWVVRYLPDLPRFIRGDPNGDGRCNVSDVVHHLRFAPADFGNPPPPDLPGCAMAYDYDGDGRITRQEAVLLMAYLFGHSTAPAPPFPSCGSYVRFQVKDDRGPSMLGCSEPGSCMEGR